MRRRRRGRRKKKDLIDRLETNLSAAIAAQAASAPSDPALSASWRPLTTSTVGARTRLVETGADDTDEAVAPSAARPDADASNDADDDGPRWPDEDEEASVLAERANSAPTTIRSQIEHAAASEEAEQAESVRDLPPLDDLIAQIPATVRDGLEDLFRAKFTKVRRLPKRVFNRPPAEE